MEHAKRIEAENDGRKREDRQALCSPGSECSQATELIVIPISRFLLYLQVISYGSVTWCVCAVRDSGLTGNAGEIM